MHRYYNPNPHNRRTGDCVIRALTKALNLPWVQVFHILTDKALIMSDMPSCNRVWCALLGNYGFRRIPVEPCTIADFAWNNPKGTYVIGTGEHVVCVEDGDWFDTWDSGEEEVLFCYYKVDKMN